MKADGVCSSEPGDTIEAGELTALVNMNADARSDAATTSPAGDEAQKHLVLTRRQVVRGLTLVPGIHLPEHSSQNTKPGPGAAHKHVRASSASSLRKGLLASGRSSPRRPAQHAPQADAAAPNYPTVPPGKPLSDRQLWALCCEMQPEWAYTYAAYHHFRSKVCFHRGAQQLCLRLPPTQDGWCSWCSSLMKVLVAETAHVIFRRCRHAPQVVQGWLPKPGLQYGGHFVLYPRHPAQCHSTFVARLVRVDSQQPTATPRDLLHDEVTHCASLDAGAVPTGHDGNQRRATDATDGADAPGGALDCNALAWVDLVACMRVAGQVRKRLLLVYLHLPSSASQLDPGSLSSMQVRLDFGLSYEWGTVSDGCWTHIGVFAACKQYARALQQASGKFVCTLRDNLIPHMTTLARLRRN